MSFCVEMNVLLVVLLIKQKKHREDCSEQNRTDILFQTALGAKIK